METWSFSKISSFWTCPKKFFWQYEQGLIPIQRPVALAQGAEFAEGVAGEDTDGPWAEIGRMARQHWKPLPGEKPEVRLEYDIAFGHKLVCILDALADEAVIEYKTTSRCTAQYYAAQALSMQHRLYALLADRRKYLLRIIKKSQIRQTQKETEEDFNARLVSLYRDKPEDFFLEIEIFPTKEGALTELRRTIQTIQDHRASNCFPQAAPYACTGFSTCQYLDLCRDYQTFRPLYTEKEKRNNEPVTSQ